MQKNELVLLHHLRKNARTTMSDVHRATKISIGWLFRKLDILDDGVVIKYSSLLDFAKLKYPIRVLFICVDDHGRFVSQIKDDISVNSISCANKGTEFLIECYFKDMKSMLEFRTLLEASGSDIRGVHHIFDDVKLESFLTDEKHINMVR